ncbi:MAG: hypothetical protein KBA61_02865 [Spirochaetes bacterium]|nr:hypothetical protein [Spirochaetota bacterium]
MKFTLLLYGFYLLLRYTSRKHPSFAEALRERDFSMAIRTADGKRSRQYLFRGGKISSGKNILPSTDFSLVWKDAASGYRYMRAMKPKALMRAVGDGSLSLAGDAETVTHFLRIFKLMIECYRGKRRSAGQ